MYSSQQNNDAGTCRIWRNILRFNQDWWQAWTGLRWPGANDLFTCPTLQDECTHPEAAGKWQQHVLNKGLHTSWRALPAIAKTLLLAEDLQQVHTLKVSIHIRQLSLTYTKYNQGSELFCPVRHCMTGLEQANAHPCYIGGRGLGLVHKQIS